MQSVNSRTPASVRERTHGRARARTHAGAHAQLQQQGLLLRYGLAKRCAALRVQRLCARERVVLGTGSREPGVRQGVEQACSTHPW